MLKFHLHQVYQVLESDSLFLFNIFVIKLPVHAA
jgi:hypothetical protein